MQTGFAQPMQWVSGWQNLDAQHAVKRHFRLYLSVDCPKEVLITLTVETENRARQKKLVFRPGARQRCVPFHVHGTRFRLKLESSSTIPWQLLGGMQLEMDVEENA